MKVGKTSVLPTALCPHCGYAVEMATGVGKADTPSPESATICIKCAGFCIFTETMSLRKMSDEEFKDYPPEAQKALTTVRPAISAMYEIRPDLKPIDPKAN